jgi:transcription elongation factor Elf1
MNSDSFVLCPRCLETKTMITLNQREEDGVIICGFCKTEWSDLETFWKEQDQKKEG